MTNTIIIGAGPAGLACAGALSQKGQTPLLLEKSPRIANSWFNHYDRLHLHTIKELSDLPYFPFPAAYPTYVSKKDLLNYYEEYKNHFKLNIAFNTEVSSIAKDNNEWNIKTTEDKTYRCQQLIICTGFNRIPNIPNFEGMDRYAGHLIHSSLYKNIHDLRSGNSLIIGMGNSGAEIALDLAEAGLETDISVRGKVNIVPRDFLGNPTQKTAKKLALLPTFIGDRIGRMVQLISMGNLKKYGLQPSPLFPAQQLREYGKTPVIDLGTIDQIKAGNIAVQTGIDTFTERGVRFKDGTEKEYRNIIMATGYDSKVHQFAPFAKPLYNKFGHPGQMAIPEQNLYFVGFDAYASGLLESIHQQALELAQVMEL